MFPQIMVNDNFYAVFVLFYIYQSYTCTQFKKSNSPTKLIKKHTQQKQILAVYFLLLFFQFPETITFFLLLFFSGIYEKYHVNLDYIFTRFFQLQIIHYCATMEDVDLDLLCPLPSQQICHLLSLMTFNNHIMCLILCFP